jgi:excinuclease UvrABC nuclease subunit
MEDCAVLDGFVNVSTVLMPGVYALVRSGVVVYVGQSRRPLSRISAHKSNWGRKAMPAWMPASLRGVLFDEVHILPCRIEDLDLVEAAMIELYKPRYNIRIKSPSPVAVALLLPQPSALKFERRI